MVSSLFLSLSGESPLGARGFQIPFPDHQGVGQRRPGRDLPKTKGKANAVADPFQQKRGYVEPGPYLVPQRKQ